MGANVAEVGVVGGNTSPTGDKDVGTLDEANGADDDVTGANDVTGAADVGASDVLASNKRESERENSNSKVCVCEHSRKQSIMLSLIDAHTQNP